MAKKPIFSFYDIESLSNVFTLANFLQWENKLEIYYLVDDPALMPPDVNMFYQMASDAIYKANKNFNGTIEFYDLSEMQANLRLARTFGLSDAKYMNDPDMESTYPKYMRLVCDSDTDYDPEKHPYLLGYNSYHYDTTMLALYEYEVFKPDKDKNICFLKTSAKTMREYNDDLFLPRFKDSKNGMESYLTVTKTGIGRFSDANYSDPRWLIRKNMMMSGRHLDVARINEKQQHVGLKRLLGMLGFQILESKQLKPGQSTIENLEQLLDLIAYNVSDVVNLAKLAEHKVYKSSFELKKGLLETYPELMYEQTSVTDPNDPMFYKPNISPKTVRRDRLTIDSSSAQFATKSLCPYNHLSDIPKVSYLYPEESKAKELGIPQINVLEEAKKFFYQNFPQSEVRAQFDVIYDYYKSIEGKNFNESDNYIIDFGVNGVLPKELEPYKLSEMPTPNLCLRYFLKDGSPSSCFVNFSTGGIHGAEYNKELYDYDCLQYNTRLMEYQKSMQGLQQDFAYVQANYPTPADVKNAKKIPMPDGRMEKPSTFINTKKLEWKSLPAFKEKPPVLFKITPKGTYKLNEKYVFTSADPTNHEDFTSYYPNLLRMMNAFFNQWLGYDRYGEVFDNKQKYGKLMKDKSLSKEQQEFYSVLREGTKLILNSASGAADATFESNIRMNNRIISMRIIGQLFTWRIGQAQTIADAKITSTNTDGLYSVLDPDINNPLLERESKNINVEIEPEPTYLISKDTNNRLEMDPDTGVIESASGGTLACRKGPNPAKSLAHPAIIDWAMAEYLIVAALKYKNLALDKDFDDTIGMSILKSARAKFKDDTQTLLMFQNIVSSSTSSNTYVFYTMDNDPTVPIATQHYNRCFYVKPKTPNSVHLSSATAKKMTPATISKRMKHNEPIQQHDPIAVQILRTNGVNIQTMSMDYEASVKKVTGIEDTWYVLMDNSDLHLMSDDKKEALFDQLNYDNYLTLFRDCFEKNWRNITPPKTQIPIPVTSVSIQDINQAKDYLLSVNTITDQNVNQTISDVSEILLKTPLDIE